MSGRTDTARLEWLAKKSRTCTVYMDGTSLFRVEGRILKCETYRDAIDAAMDAEEQG